MGIMKERIIQWDEISGEEKDFLRGKYSGVDFPGGSFARTYAEL